MNTNYLMHEKENLNEIVILKLNFHRQRFIATKYRTCTGSGYGIENLKLNRKTD
jgi:hypothetical protein